MNRINFACLVILGALTSFSGVAPWEKTTISSIKRLPARTSAVPCESEDLAIEIAELTQSKFASRWVRSLNGVWDFKWKRASSKTEWEKSSTIVVPSCWQLQGAYDPALYTNVTYPILLDAPRVTGAPKDTSWTSYEYRDPVALYTTTFRRPWRWFGRRTILHFDGVGSAFFVRVNGKDVGYAEDSRLPSEFDVTPYLHVFGKNTLEVEVHKHSDGSYLEDQDFWRLSGIFRDVYLISELKDAPHDLIVETKLSHNLRDGSFVVRDEMGVELKRREVKDVSLWSPEIPDSYTTSYEQPWGIWSTCPWKWWFLGGIDYRVVSFGFRKVEIRDSVLYLNGRRVLFKGVNRHEMQPESGYTVTMENMRKDIELMKSFNINAVRTCHYPDCPDWYRLCDLEGLMVVCEANIESHGYDIYSGTNSLSFRLDYAQSHIERAERMVRTFRNHPSILIWSMGNESGYGPNFKSVYRSIKRIDPTRPVQYENYCATCLGVGKGVPPKAGTTGDETNFTDIECPMYTDPKEVESYVASKPAKPFILCEYAHAMGNSTGSIDKYWNLARKYPSFQGGFVWDFADQALWKSDARGKWLAYGGDFGDQPNDANFNCNGLFDALRNPHPGAYEIKHFYQNIECENFNFETKRVMVRNNYVFRKPSDFECEWKAWNSSSAEPCATGYLDIEEINVGESKPFTLEKFQGETVTFFIYDSEERFIAWNSFTKPFEPKKLDLSKATSVQLPVKMNFWRAPTDNDRGWGMPKVCKVWKDATTTQRLPAGVKSELKASRLADGSTCIDWSLTVPKGLPPIPRVGLTFTVPMTNVVEYYGRGPWENYSDRASGAYLAAHTASLGLVSGLANPQTGTIDYPENRLNPDNYIRPGEQGYRTDCRRLTIGGVTIEAVNAPFGFNVWPYAQSMLENKGHQWELKAANELTVNIDAAQMGVGGDDSWGRRPHDEFMLGAGTYHLSFILKGL